MLSRRALIGKAAVEATATDRVLAELLPHAERLRRFASADGQLR